MTHLLLALLLAGCGSTIETPPADNAAALPAEGARYDPPIDPAEVPDGAWMCDMGTVHYAAPHEGKCPECGMKLTEKKAKKAE